MLENILEFDQNLLLYLNNLGNTNWDAFWFAVTNKLTFIPLYIFLLYLMTNGQNRKAVFLIVFILAIMITFTDQVTNLFKDGFERLRPCADKNISHLLRIGDCRGFGFFSGHSSNSMSAAVFTILFLRSKYRKIIYLMIPWTLLVGYSRIYIGKHYPLDVLCGWLFGAFAGYIFFKLFKFLKRRFV